MLGENLEIHRGNDMKHAWLEEYLLSHKGATSDFKVEWNWLRFQVGEKMFAAICEKCVDGRDILTLKLEPSEGEFLRNQYQDIIPGYYMNKEHWNSIFLDGDIPNELLRELIDKSYQLVLQSLTKKKQEAILENN